MYTPVKVPSSRDAHLQAMAVGLEAANAILPLSLCTNPMLPLAGTLAIFQATLDSLVCSTKGQGLGHQKWVTTLPNGSLP